MKVTLEERPDNLLYASGDQLAKPSLWDVAKAGRASELPVVICRVVAATGTVWPLECEHVSVDVQFNEVMQPGRCLQNVTVHVARWMREPDAEPSTRAAQTLHEEPLHRIRVPSRRTMGWAESQPARSGKLNTNAGRRAEALLFHAVGHPGEVAAAVKRVVHVLDTVSGPVIHV
jgi:hypothetical protein